MSRPVLLLLLTALALGCRIERHEPRVRAGAGADTLAAPAAALDEDLWEIVDLSEPADTAGGGSRVLAPAEADPNGTRVDELPLERLIGPAAVLPGDGREGVDLDGWETRWGPLPDDAIVLLRAPATPETVRRLVTERRIGALGLEAGVVLDDSVRVLAAGAGVPIVQGLRSLHRLPASGATVVALPVRHVGGASAPARIIALVRR